MRAVRPDFVRGVFLSNMKCKLVSLLVGVIAFAGYAFGGEKPWIEVKSPHFRVLTDSSAGDGKLVAREFEDFRAVSFRQGERFRWGYSDTFWYGQNHISICQGLEGKRTIVFYKPLPSATPPENHLR